MDINQSTIKEDHYLPSSVACVIDALENLSFPSSNGNGGERRQVDFSASSSSLTATAPPFIPSNCFPRGAQRTPPALVAELQPPPGFGQQPRAMNQLSRPQNNSSYGFDSKLFRTMTCREGVAEFQMLLERCDEEKLRELGSWLTSDRALLVALTKNQYGSSCVRKLLRKSNHVDHQILSAVLDAFVPLMTSKYGHYLVTETLDAVDEEEKEAIYEAAEIHALILANDEVGCVSLNDLINNLKGRYRESILSLIASNALWLSKDPSGNFVVQHVLKLHNPIYTQTIARLLHGNYVQLSFLKFGSYVVELCLNSHYRWYVIDELIKSSELVRMARSEFGNYVMQRAMKVTHRWDAKLYQQLVEKLKPHYGVLQRGYGRNIVNLIESLCVNSGEHQ